MSNPVVIVASDRRKGRERCKVRKVEIDTVAREAAKTGKIVVQHGGGVANKYGFPAWTECVLAVPLPDLDVVVAWASYASANKVSLGGAAAACLPEARALFDTRFGDEKRTQARLAVLSAAHDAVLEDE